MGKNILTKELLLKSVEEWNRVREANPDIIPDLCGVDLRGAYLNDVDLHGATLCGADLTGAHLIRAYLGGAYLSGATLNEADLFNAYLSRADLCGAVLNYTNLGNTNLSEANLSRAILKGTNLNGADIRNAEFSRVIAGGISFGAVDLSGAIGLDTILHTFPSTIGIDTFYASNGKIPEVFLRGCGVPDNFIDYVCSLTAKAFDYYSCFISHSTADKVFADRLHADLQAKGVRCWYAPHDMEGGEHVETQIDRAIKIHEKVLLVLSESSINSNWVKREITKAVKREEAEGKRVLFPISLVEFSTLEAWEFVDSKGRDLSEEIRKFYIPSFKGWENDNSLYTTEFDKLLKAFKDKSKQ